MPIHGPSAARILNLVTCSLLITAGVLVATGRLGPSQQDPPSRELPAVVWRMVESVLPPGVGADDMILLVVADSHCPHCHELLGRMPDISERLGPGGVPIVVLLITPRGPKTWPAIGGTLEVQDSAQAGAKALGASKVPVTFLLTGSGYIRASVKGAQPSDLMATTFLQALAAEARR